MKIICFGDSNTWGYDPRGFFGGRHDDPWPALLARKTGHTVLNQGENGREIPQRPAAFPEDTDLLIVMLGTNDLLQGLSADSACRKMEKFLKSLALDRSRLLLLAPPLMKPGAWVPDEQLTAASGSLTGLYRSLAADLGIRFADTGSWGIPLAYDGVHFTGEGHRIFAEELARILK